MAWIKITLVLLVLIAVCVLAEDQPPKKYTQTRGPAFDDSEDVNYGSKRVATKKVRVKTPRKPMLSAWGIVFLILSLIFVGVAAYYFYLFYPIYFKKPRQYDNMELVTVKV